MKRARKQGLVEGNVRWLRKAACVSQSVKRDLISSHFSLSIDLSPQLAGVSWLAVAEGHFLAPAFWVGFGTRKPHASKSQKMVLSPGDSQPWKGRRWGSANKARCDAGMLVPYGSTLPAVQDLFRSKTQNVKIL